MLVRVDMVKREPGGAKCLELSTDLRGKPDPDTGREEIPQCGPRLMRIELSVMPR